MQWCSSDKVNECQSRESQSQYVEIPLQSTSCSLYSRVAFMATDCGGDQYDFYCCTEPLDFSFVICFSALIVSGMLCQYCFVRLNHWSDPRSVWGDVIKPGTTWSEYQYNRETVWIGNKQHQMINRIDLLRERWLQTYWQGLSSVDSTQRQLWNSLFMSSVYSFLHRAAPLMKDCIWLFVTCPTLTWLLVSWENVRRLEDVHSVLFTLHVSVNWLELFLSTLM